MIGGTVGEVVDSRHPKFKAGDSVVGMGGWQEYSAVDANVPGALRKVDTTHVPLSHYLGAVGMPGVTAWWCVLPILWLLGWGQRSNGSKEVSLHVPTSPFRSMRFP
jgi:NADPH-dependent curcumin reductase CurA